jgi:hypothetical protein
MTVAGRVNIGLLEAPIKSFAGVEGKNRAWLVGTWRLKSVMGKYKAMRERSIRKVHGANRKCIILKAFKSTLK